MEKFQTAPIFTDGMVLQRDKNICVFGTGEEGTLIHGELCGFHSSCVVKDGKWKITFPRMGACRHVILKLYDDDNDQVVRLENVAIGEVWLAGGQSNMELELCNCKGGKEVLENDDTKDVRFYYVPKKTIYDDDYEESMQNAAWTDFSDKESAKHWSAVGYFFAKEMSQYLDVTVGVIGCNWGGTSASCWIDREYATGDTKVYFDDYDASVEGKDLNKMIADYREYEKYQNAWWCKSAEYYANTEDPSEEGCVEYCGGPSKYPGPAAPCNPYSPGILHESMISRVVPYTLGGVIWYQGETDEIHPDAYYTLLTQLIRNWREDWGDDELPFIIGQLPMYAGGDPDGDSWSRIREAQMRVYKTIKNTGIAVLLDCGERDNIHPVDKQPVGHRFAMQALDMVYGGCDGAFAPTFKNAVWRGDMVELQFDNARGGFKVRGESEDLGFEICGEDGVYVPAYADVSGERIFLSADEVEHPCAVRYLWKNYAEISIFSGFGLPLAPFRINK